ncbi:ATP-binding SpoIIE family protein phosphatase [Streptomyces gilvus]|uniref:ATP-binding SpoIIE family protein phosphatase n=1 Tax=Streptomyces gilvus TaxID=2920937 RepID=UPI001F0F74D5|nr:SpoIIE family protein phosphatase [Streptomyces sp. CME 23]MCH5671491.1 SpoIIE family protein phosphatase [Streptomyces sp. CME 23]
MAVSNTGPYGDAAADEVAVILLDDAGAIQRWPGAATRLLGHEAEEVCGRPVTQLLVDARRGVEEGVFRHRSGGPIELTAHMTHVDGPCDVLLLSAPGRGVTERERCSTFLRALPGQEQLGVIVFGPRLDVVGTNDPVRRGGQPLLSEGRRLREVISGQQAESLLRQVLETGAPLLGRELPVEAADPSGQDLVLSVSAFRLEDAHGHPTGVVALITGNVSQRRAMRRATVSHEASARIGDSLDVTRTAQDIADVLVPSLADMASVDVAEVVLEGDEPAKGVLPGERWRMRRVAVASADGPWPGELIPVGGVIPPLPDVPQVRRAALHGDTLLNTSRREMAEVLGDPDMIRALLPETGREAVVSPLFARGRLLGFVSAWRTEGSEPFQAEDADLVFDIASRAALSVDNARRYTREHRAAVALQQRLLPPATTRSTAAESAGCYVPASGGAHIGGDWFDVIPLPSLRVAFVIGDVAGHGLPAAATMGRLRTAIRTLADLELDPGELLIHLDDLVQQIAEEADADDRDGVGATCLYAVYDPLTATCSLAAAGHVPPAVLGPDGSGSLIRVQPGPPLGVGGMPFEVTTVPLEPDSTLAFYTDGLVERPSGDLDQGIEELLATLSSLWDGEQRLEDIARAAVAAAHTEPPRDDAALLLARIQGIPTGDSAHWQFPDDLARVAEARKAVTRQLGHWGLEDLTFTTELIVSELVTNAMRYAGGTVGLRVFHDQATLVCEVTDSSNTQPRLRRARLADEGGRGLFLVAQLAKRWGSRYHQTGKTIWAEQPIGAEAAAAAAAFSSW